MKSCVCDRCQAPNATGWTVTINTTKEPDIFVITYVGDLCRECRDSLESTLVQSYRLTQESE